MFTSKMPHCFSNMLPFLLLLCFNGAVTSSSSSVPSKIGNGYRLISIQQTPDGALLGQLQVKQPNDIYGPDIPLLQLFVKQEIEDRLRVHITDAEKQRWEVPYDLLPRQHPPTKTAAQLGVQDSSTTSGELIFNYTEDPFSFSVTRKSDGETLFNSRSEESDPFGSMVFKDQYIEISTKLPEEASLYGLGESTRPSGIKLKAGESYTLYVSDAMASEVNIPLCGSHPVYMDLRDVKGEEAHAHGVLLLNSNGMDVFYRGTSLTYKIIGGVLDFYFFAGQTPLRVVDQYTSLIGRPAPMPYWAFGFHQSKWGYKDISVVEEVIEKYNKAQIPLDVIWSDDDYMDLHRDFTLSPVNYPLQRLTSFLDKIHNSGMKYVVIVEPGISTNSTYGVHQRALENDVYIKHNGRPVLGQVWAGPVHFPDYLNPKTVSWWIDEIHGFLQKVPVDGLWLDMNEPLTFCFGECKSPEESGRPCPGDGPFWVCCLNCDQTVARTRWDDPPYKINVRGSQQPLDVYTIALSAVHYNGVLEYDAHSLYGLTQSIATHKALLDLRGTRPFVLSRASFVGLGKYAAHWTGDNHATWDDLKYSIPTMLNFGIFGVPMIGSDICGFYPAPTEELCNRWIELGAFYPFSRNHANVASPSQELYLWDSVAESSRIALGMRYKLLPYLYTLNYEAHTTGAPIARPLFFSFPNYKECYGLSTQFLLGSGLMVSPVLEKGKTQVNALFPPGSWYNMFNMSQVINLKKGGFYTLDAPLHVINVHVYQNTIMPMQRGAMVSKDVRMTPFTLVVTFPVGAIEGEAKGNLFIDNDELPEMKVGNGQSTYVEFHANVSYGWVKLWSEIQEGEFALSKGLVIEKVMVLGLDGRKGPLDLRFYGVDVSATTSKVQMRSLRQMIVESDDGASRESTMVEVSGLEIPIGKSFGMVFHMEP
ncbi:Alpha-xylosidase 1 [Linum perenne]